MKFLPVPLFLMLSFSTIFELQTSFAYTLSTTDTGKQIRWKYGQKFFLAGNPTGRDGFPSDLFRSAVVDGLQQWKWATHGMVDFDYWQGTTGEYETNLKNNGLSSIFFASNSQESIDQNIIGYTKLWFNSNNGDIIEADIMLNDRDYELTNSPYDTSSSHNHQFSRPKVYLNNIITHELGHAIGLSHSGNINSSMLYVEYAEQSKIGCDDWAGARHLYPSDLSGIGTLTGTILAPNGDPVAGAMVTAISKQRGIPIASVHSDQNGRFYFGALEAGGVALMIEHFQGSTNSVPT